MRNFLVSIFGLSLILFFVACEKRPKAPESSTKEGVVIAKVGDKTITDQELMERVEAIEKTFPRIYSTHIQKKKLLEEMIHIELLYEEALAAGLNKKYEFKSRLADLYVQQLSEKAKASITEKQIKDFFEANKDRFEQISARHILLKTDRAKASEKKALKDKLESYRQELLKDPSKFSEYAQKYSDDGSKANGGELGFFTRPMMVAPFSKAAFALKNLGDISPVVESQFGFHIIQLSGDRRGFEAYKETVREQILRTTQRERLDQELQRLAKTHSTEIYEDNLAKLSPLPKEMTVDPKELIPDEPK